MVHYATRGMVLRPRLHMIGLHVARIQVVSTCIHLYPSSPYTIYMYIGDITATCIHLHSDTSCSSRLLVVGVNAALASFFTCVSYAEARNRYRLDVRLSVRLSVCLSVTRWHPIKTAEYIVMVWYSRV